MCSLQVSSPPWQCAGKRTHGMFSISFLLFLVMLFPMVAAGSVPSPETKSILCQISCGKSVSFRTGTGPWVNQPAGSYPAALPVEMTSGPSPCRIQIGSETVIEGSPFSEMVLSASGSGNLVVLLKKGGVLYSVPSKTDITIQVPAQKVTASAGKTVTSRNAVADSGIVRICEEEESAVEIASLQGAVSVRKEGDELRTLDSGSALRVAHLASTAPSNPSQSLASVGLETGPNKPAGTVSASSNNTYQPISVQDMTQSSADSGQDDWKVRLAANGATVESPKSNCCPPPPPTSCHPRLVWCWYHWRFCTEDHSRCRR